MLHTSTKLKPPKSGCFAGCCKPTSCLSVIEAKRPQSDMSRGRRTILICKIKCQMSHVEGLRWSQTEREEASCARSLPVPAPPPPKKRPNMLQAFFNETIWAGPKQNTGYNKIYNNYMNTQILYTRISGVSMLTLQMWHLNGQKNHSAMRRCDHLGPRQSFAFCRGRQ